MTNAAPGGAAAVAARTGPIHDFALDSPLTAEAFLAAKRLDDLTVPVVVRSLSGAGVVGRGRLVDSRAPAGSRRGIRPHAAGELCRPIESSLIVKTSEFLVHAA